MNASTTTERYGRTLTWKPDWDACRANLTAWWEHRGLALCLTAPRSKPLVEGPPPQRPSDDALAWTDPAYRLAVAEHQLGNTVCYAESFPYFDTQIGPGSLGLFLGAEPVFEPTTVWYEPCIDDSEQFGAIDVDPTRSRWWDVHMAVIEKGLADADGRFLVGVPDLIENIDTLAAMRDNQPILMDLVERPEWVKQRLGEINQAFFRAFDLMYDRVKDCFGGNAFSAFKLWGPGKTAKVQCDFCCMISQHMFREFVVPPLAEQCAWLDYAMYHLDGTQAIHQLDALLEIESLDAIEWTPQAGIETGGDPRWYDMYRRILAAGKSVQAIYVKVDQVIPLLDAVGPDGMFMTVYASCEAEAEDLLTKVEAYR